MLLELLDGRLIVDILGLLTREAKSGAIPDSIVNATASKILDIEQETLFFELVEQIVLKSELGIFLENLEVMLTRVRAAQADRVSVGQSDRDQKNVDSRKNYTQRSQGIEVNRNDHLLAAVNFNDVAEFVNLVATR